MFDFDFDFLGSTPTQKRCRTEESRADVRVDSYMVTLNMGEATHKKGRLNLTITSAELAPRSSWR